jgi:hypothetical protein
MYKASKKEWHLKKQAQRLGNLLERDLKNIDFFVRRWHEFHKPAKTDWNGNRINS